MRRLQELLTLTEASHGVHVDGIDNIEKAKKAAVQFVMMSPISVVAHYNDYPVIDVGMQEIFDRFFKRRWKATGNQWKGYFISLEDSGQLEDLFRSTEEYFNDEDEGPGSTWPFTFEVKA